jgi:hypothetical protein
MFVVLCPKRCLWGVERTNIYTFHSLDKGYWHYSRGGGTADGCFGWGVGPLVRPGQVGGGQSEPPPTLPFLLNSVVHASSCARRSKTMRPLASSTVSPTYEPGSTSVNSRLGGSLLRHPRLPACVSQVLNVDDGTSPGRDLVSPVSGSLTIDPCLTRSQWRATR